MFVEIERLANYKSLMDSNKNFRELHKKIEEKVIRLAEKEGYKRIQFGTIADFWQYKGSGGKMLRLTTMTLARLLKW